ncbi:MAG: hypothetical protein JKY68_04590, partial [Rhodospirillales bacterium]|nr:hypothetical protein [Rhodospirillales bacterium]
MIDQQIIFMIIGGSALAMLLLGGGIIGLFLYNRPKVLRRRRIEQIGHLNGGENGSSDKAETRRQKRIREKVKQLEDSGDKKSWIDAIRRHHERGPRVRDKHQSDTEDIERNAHGEMLEFREFSPAVIIKIEAERLPEENTRVEVHGWAENVRQIG